MKKIKKATWISLFTLFLTLLLTAIPQFNSETYTKSQNRVMAQTTESCVVLEDSDIKDIGDKINEYYAKGYRLKGFTASRSTLGSDEATVSLHRGFAAVCKE